MRHTLIALALGLVLPLGVAHASIESDLKAGQPLQTVLTNALASNTSMENALKQVFELAPDQSMAAVTAATQLTPDQAANIVSLALSRQYNLDPSKVVAAALQGAPEKAGVIVPTAIVKSPSYHTVAIVQRALAEGVDGSKFIPQAMRVAPRQADSILTQALRSAPPQTQSIMEAVIADQPDRASDLVKVALAAAPGKSSAILAAAFKVVPRQANQIAAVATEAGVPDSVMAAASQAAGVEVAGLTQGQGSNFSNSASSSGMNLGALGAPGAGGGGGGSNACLNPNGTPVSPHRPGC